MSAETRASKIDNDVIVETYDKLADFYEKDVNAWYTSKLLLHLMPKTAQSILEVACGTGQVLQEFQTALDRQQRDFRAVGLDITPAMIERAQQRLINSPHIQTVCGDIFSYPLEEKFGKFDYIFANYMLIYVDPEAFFQRLKALLNPGGKFVIFEQMKSVNPGVVRYAIDTLRDGIGYVAYRVRNGMNPGILEIVNKAPYTMSLYQQSAWKESQWGEFHQFAALTVAELTQITKKVGANIIRIGATLVIIVYDAPAQ